MVPSHSPFLQAIVFSTVGFIGVMLLPTWAGALALLLSFLVPRYVLGRLNASEYSSHGQQALWASGSDCFNPVAIIIWPKAVRVKIREERRQTINAVWRDGPSTRSRW